MTQRATWLLAGAFLLVLPGLDPAGISPAGAQEPADLVLVQGGDAAAREAERAWRELQRQQRIMECQNRVLAQQSRYASPAEFLRAREACAAAR